VKNSCTYNTFSEVFLFLKDTPFYEDADDPDGGYWSGTWNYEQIWLEDHFALPIFKTSRLLNKITRLQVTSPDMDGRESEIPIPFKRVPDLHPASDHLMVISVSSMFLVVNLYS
jgi:hypothetical protein